MVTGVEGGVLGGAAHDDTEQSAEGVGLFGRGVALVPIVRDVFLANPCEPFSDEVQDYFDLLIAAGTDLTKCLLHQHAFLLEINSKSSLIFVKFPNIFATINLI